MPKIKKLKRSKKFRVNVNRKRLRNKLKKLPNIECKIVKDAWEEKQSVIKNLKQMGLAFDANEAVKIPNIKKEMLKVVENENDENDENTESNEESVPKKIHVVQNLEAEARWPRAKLFRLPNNEVQFATYMMDKYGDDYDAMVRDSKNYYQMTACQIRRKIERFKSIPEQYAEYLVKKGEIILENPIKFKNLKPELMKNESKKNPDQKPSKRKRNRSKLLQSAWKEESIEDVSFVDIKETVQDNDTILEQPLNSEKKLKLFPDENDSENDDDDDKEIFHCSSDEEIENDCEISSNKKVKVNRRTALKLKGRPPKKNSKKLKKK